MIVDDDGVGSTERWNYRFPESAETAEPGDQQKSWSGALYLEVQMAAIWQIQSTLMTLHFGFCSPGMFRSRNDTSGAMDYLLKSPQPLRNQFLLPCAVAELLLCAQRTSCENGSSLQMSCAMALTVPDDVLNKLPGPIEGPMVWRGKELAAKEPWVLALTEADNAELLRATRSVEGLDFTAIGMTRFPLPSLGPKLVAVRQEVLFGRGFSVLRGLQVEGLPMSVLARLYWGLGTWLGEAVSQNKDGQLLGHVTDIGAKADHPTQRGFQSSDSLPFHTDTAGDIISLLCLRPAKTGGLSSVASAGAVYNVMRSECPELLAELLTPVAWDRRGEIPPGKQAWYRMPVFSYHNGRLIVSFVHRFIVSAPHLPGAPALSDRQRCALDKLIETAADEEISLSMDFRAGDIQLVNNLAVLHNRTAYEDHEPPAPRRHLLRLWLAAADGWALPPAFWARYPGKARNGRPEGIVLAGVQPAVRLDARAS